MTETRTTAAPNRVESKTDDSKTSQAAKDVADRDKDLSPDEQATLATVPIHGTVEDANGVERIVVPNLNTDWEPAPVEPHEGEVARLEKMLKHLDNHKQKRLDALKAKPAKT